MEKDMTAGRPGKIIFNFTMPIFIGNIFQQFYNMADTVIVGKFVGNAALAAVGACGTLVFLIIGFLQGVTAGFTVVTAQHFGAGNMKAMKKSVASGAVLTGIVTVILTLLSMISMAKVLHLMNTPSDMYGEAYGYIMVICGGIVAQALYNYLASVLRALGDSKRPLYFLVITANLSHILAVSGAHTSYIILGLTYIITKSKAPRRIGYIITIIILLVFIIITGASYSVIRACIMSIITISAKLFYKKENFFISICVSLFIILIQNPFAINDIGLKLSFLGTIGIIVFNKNITEFFIRIKIKENIAKVLSLTFSAQLMIMPITILNFNTFSLTFFISNILASPLLGIIIILGFIAIFVSFVLNSISKILFFVLNLFLELLIFISEIVTKIPGSSILVKTPNLVFVITYYILILFINYFFIIKKNPIRRFQKKIIKICTIKNIKRIIKIIARIFLIISFLTMLVRVINPTLKIYFIDVGQGDCALIITPKGKKILIDGGEGKNEILLPYLLDRGINKIDYIIISHFDSDHCNGLIEVMEKIKVRKVIVSKQPGESEEYRNILEIIKRKNIEAYVVKAQDRITIEKDLYINILNPAGKLEFNDLNNNAMVAKLIYKNFSMLFTGDIEKAEENIAQKYKNNLKSTILKVAHHGSKTSTNEEFLKYVEPQIALIGVGENNKFGHPNQQTIEKLKNIRS